jgi:hypothetical protein
MTRAVPFGTVGNGVTEKDELIRQDLSHLFEIVKNKLQAFFIREKAQGRLVADADMLLGKVKRSPQPVEAAVREALAHLRRYVAPWQLTCERDRGNWGGRPEKQTGGQAPHGTIRRKATTGYNLLQLCSLAKRLALETRS